MKQARENTLAVSFVCPADIEVGMPVGIVDDLEVARQAGLAPLNIIGNVIAHLEDALSCTVSTRFRERRDDRDAAAEMSVGPFVFDADMKAVQYTEALPATVTGTNAQPFLPVTGATDKLKIKIGGGTSQTFTLLPADTTAALVAARIMLTATDFTASATADLKLKLTVNDHENSLIIEAIANDDYTELGLTAGTTTRTARSHDPASIAGMVIKLPVPCSITGTVREPYAIVLNSSDKFKLNIGGGAPQTFTLDAGTAVTAQEIADTINLTATDCVASAAHGCLVITASEPWQDIEIETVANDCYDELGFEAGTTSAPTTIETLEK